MRVGMRQIGFGYHLLRKFCPKKALEKCIPSNFARPRVVGYHGN